jgi:hypothetical protein
MDKGHGRKSHSHMASLPINIFGLKNALDYEERSSFADLLDLPPSYGGSNLHMIEDGNNYNN